MARLETWGGTSFKLWDTMTGQHRSTFDGHKGRVMDVAFSADGKLIASGSFETTVKLWDFATGDATDLRGTYGCRR